MPKISIKMTTFASSFKKRIKKTYLKNLNAKH